MKSVQLTITDPIGLHARPASKLTAEASKYKSDITITFNGRVANAKSLINIMSLNVKSGAIIELVVKGLDEEQAFTGCQSVMRANGLIK
ncbi:MAG: HPr family phosphocarrier protein [Mycoplasmataceae bacterium]|jgi:phosphocarrier protein|nr:HPr family phosphocarrier protein [Mycoplasmataceae bacterium]